MSEYLAALLGGATIGLAAIMMLLFNGRILGVSGIIGGLLQKNKESKLWRFSFTLGILCGGLLLRTFYPTAFEISVSRSIPALVVSGLLVGYGTRLGGGCTSGHGVCGVSRLSPRSLMATLTFILSGATVVFIINHVLGGLI